MANVSMSPPVCRVRDIVFTRPLDRPLRSQPHAAYTLATRSAFPGKALLVYGESVEPDCVVGVFCLEAGTFTPGQAVRQVTTAPDFVATTPRYGTDVPPDVVEFARAHLRVLRI